MTGLTSTFVVGGLSLALACGAAGQHDHGTHSDSLSTEARKFVERARVAAERFRDPAVATLTGYRLLGPDFPGMGYHWVNGALAAEGRVDPDNPPVISYLQVGDRLLLTGVAFALPVRSEADLPDLPFPGAWHVHSGTVDDETLILNPASMKHPGGEDWKLGMLHAWVVVDNPAGVFEQDNWALPFLRCGLEPPQTITPQQGKALFLITGGQEYYFRLIAKAARPNSDERHRITGILKEYTESVMTSVAALETGLSDYVALLETLDRVWSGLWTDIRRAVRESVWGEISMLAG